MKRHRLGVIHLQGRPTPLQSPCGRIWRKRRVQPSYIRSFFGIFLQPPFCPAHIDIIFSIRRPLPELHPPKDGVKKKRGLYRLHDANIVDLAQGANGQRWQAKKVELHLAKTGWWIERGGRKWKTGYKSVTDWEKRSRENSWDEGTSWCFMPLSMHVSHLQVDESEQNVQSIDEREKAECTRQVHRGFVPWNDPGLFQVQFLA